MECAKHLLHLQSASEWLYNQSFFFAHTLESEEWFSALNMRSHEQISYPVERIYRVSQQVWDMLNVPFWSSEKFASEASYVYKIWPIKKGEILNFDK